MEWNKLDECINAFNRICKNTCNLCGICGYNKVGGRVKITNCGSKRDMRIVRMYLEELKKGEKHEQS